MSITKTKIISTVRPTTSTMNKEEIEKEKEGVQEISMMFIQNKTTIIISPMGTPVLPMVMARPIPRWEYPIPLAVLTNCNPNSRTKTKWLWTTSAVC